MKHKLESFEKKPVSVIKAIAILFFTISATLALVGVLLFIPGLIKFLFDNAKTDFYLGMLVMSIPFLLMAIVFWMLGKGIWSGQNWARIVTLLFTFLSIIDSLSTLSGASLFSKASYLALIETLSSVKLLISLLIFGYLGFSKKSKKYFS